MRFITPFLLVGCLALAACGGKRIITGVVTDASGQPLDRAIVRLEPGNIEMVTDREGQFTIEYLRTEDASRTGIGKRQTYILDVFKPGFSIEQREFYYKAGALSVGAIPLTVEVLRVQDDGENLVPSLQAEPTNTGGATYEGQ
ncbi:MAG: hypothetical protein ACJAZO_000306 [Myxococcota bacterium]|jgi:hypothetical protein